MLHRIPTWFQNLFPGYIWNKKTGEKIIYITFDDGPIPHITEWVLEVLEQYNIKATFFVVGENVARHPHLIKKIKMEGHSIGNHTNSHVKGWGVSATAYLNDIEKCSQTINEYTSERPRLFRPPHGRIRPSQARLLRAQFELIMWDTLSVDYDNGLSEEKCLQNSIRASQPGSIIVFHDSIKAEKNLKYVLPKYIKHFQEQGFTFKVL